MHKKPGHFTLAALPVGLACLALAFLVPGARAQAPAPDGYEENDSLGEASNIPVGAELGSLSMSPANDPDWFRVLVSPPDSYPGQYRVEVVGTPGLDLTLNLYGPSAALMASHNDPSGPNAAITFDVSSEGYYAVEVLNGTVDEGWYVLRLVDLTPAPTPSPTPAPTLLPTPTSPFPTSTPTPEMGGAPDYTEPNYDFATAYRIVPGDSLTNLNFNPGSPDGVDNDFFVMAVRPGVTYTCRTEDLGQGVDTNLIVYGSADLGDALGGNDDVDTQSGRIDSRVTFTATAEGDVYALVGYKHADLRRPGGATYTLTCIAGAPAPPPGAGGGTGMPRTTSVTVRALQRPEMAPTPTPVPVVPQTVDVLVGYDRNDNGQIDPNEGVRGISVRVIDADSNRALSHGFTGESGTVRFILATERTIRVVIPFLGAAEDFRPGRPVQWTLLIPPGIAPGLIP